MLYDVVNALLKVGKCNIFFEGVSASVDVALAKSAEVDDSFAQGLAGDGTDVGADTAQDVLFFNEDDFASEFDSLNGSALSGGTGSDDK